MKKSTDRKNTIDPAHAKVENRTHDRDQLRRRLLKMILQNEALRRSAETKNRPRAVSSGSFNHLAVFDPEDFIGRELATGNNEQKSA